MPCVLVSIRRLSAGVKLFMAFSVAALIVNPWDALNAAFRSFTSAFKRLTSSFDVSVGKGTDLRSVRARGEIDVP